MLRKVWDDMKPIMVEVKYKEEETRAHITLIPVILIPIVDLLNSAT